MANTPTINLRKPARADFVSVVNDINDNMDKIDSYANTTNEAIGTLSSLTTTEKSNLVGAVNEVNSNVTNMATRLATKAFTTNGSTGGGQTTMTVTLPEGALFDNIHSLFIICSIRQATGHGDDGYAALKLNSGAVVAMQKMGMTNCTNFAYDATTRNLTFTAPSYMTCCVFGMASS